MSNKVGAGRRLRTLAGGLAAGALAVTAIGAISSADSASAGTPDRYGFVLWNGGAVDPTGTTPAGTTVTPGSPGIYKINFPGQAAKGGVVHVTAINDAPHWCQVNSFGVSGPDEFAVVSCHKVGGAVDNSAFSAIFSSSSGAPTTPGGAFGYVDSQASGVLNSSYNSAAAPNTVVPGPPGVWTVKFAGLATPGPIDGSWQATAVSQPGLPMRCKVAGWSSGAPGQTAQVNCYNAAGALANTEFTLTYQYQRALTGGAFPPNNFGYLLNQPVGGPPSTSYNSMAGANTLVFGAISSVTFGKIGVTPDDIQVTAYGSNSDFCGMATPWGHSGPDTVVKAVNCFTNAGTPDKTGFLISDTSAV